jgi:hypothetical protein
LYLQRAQPSTDKLMDLSSFGVFLMVWPWTRDDCNPLSDNVNGNKCSTFLRDKSQFGCCS